MVIIKKYSKKCNLKFAKLFLSEDVETITNKH